jgi:hypothetical protein
VPKQFASRFYACVCGLIVVSADPRNGAHDPKACKFSFRGGMPAPWNQPDVLQWRAYQALARLLSPRIRRRERTACWQSLGLHAFSVANMLHDAPRQAKSVRSKPGRPQGVKEAHKALKPFNGRLQSPPAPAISRRFLRCRAARRAPCAAPSRASAAATRSASAATATARAAAELRKQVPLRPRLLRADELDHLRPNLPECAFHA